MWVIWTLLLLGVIYVAVGVLVGYVNAQSKDDDFIFSWSKVLTWPKEVFGIGR